jgi:SP family sugar:H+ symporter-like MFS transporter
MVCKCINGIAIGHIIAVGPIYGVECTVASKRGLLMSLYNIGLALGNAVAAAVCAGSSSYRSNLAWQLLIICQLPLSFILGLGVLFFPESPRWLLVAGKEESARNSFGRFYNKDPQSDEITRQILEVHRHIEMEKAAGATSF